MKCDYCDNVIDNNLSVCPHCGAPIEKQGKKVVKVITVNSNNVIQNVAKNNVNNRFIDMFLYGVIVGGIILIIILILLRFK